MTRFEEGLPAGRRSLTHCRASGGGVRRHPSDMMLLSRLQDWKEIATECDARPSQWRRSSLQPQRLLKSTRSCLSSPLTIDYRRLDSFLLSRDKRWVAHQPFNINQYECLTVSPSAARHHVLVLTLPRSSAPRRCLNFSDSISVCRRDWILRSSFSDYSNPYI